MLFVCSSSINIKPSWSLIIVFYNYAVLMLPYVFSFRGSTREAALVKLVDAFESFMLHGLVENRYIVFC
jgi:hypothetical protein